MVFVVEHIAIALKHARQAHKLSQRALSQKAGLPQAQISKIENAVVDPKASSLIALARALDLELVLVPRQYVPAMQHLFSAAKPAKDGASPLPAYALGDETDDG